jgi:hypothetical protein
VVTVGAAAGLISSSVIGVLAATPPFGWLAGLFGIGLTATLPFFVKLGIRGLRDHENITQHKAPKKRRAPSRQHK